MCCWSDGKEKCERENSLKGRKIKGKTWRFMKDFKVNFSKNCEVQARKFHKIFQKLLKISKSHKSYDKHSWNILKIIKHLYIFLKISKEKICSWAVFPSHIFTCMAIRLQWTIIKCVNTYFLLILFAQIVEKTETKNCSTLIVVNSDVIWWNVGYCYRHVIRNFPLECYSVPWTIAKWNCDWIFRSKQKHVHQLQGQWLRIMNCNKVTNFTLILKYFALY